MAKLVRIVIQLPMDLKTRLDGLKQQGYTTSGFIRAMLERELTKIDQQMPDQKPLSLVPAVKIANSRYRPSCSSNHQARPRLPLALTT